MNTISMLRCLFGLLLVICLSAAPVLGGTETKGRTPGGATKPANKAGNTQPGAAVGPAIKVVGLVGSPQMVVEGQPGAAVTQDMLVPVGATVQTDEVSRVALAVASSMNLPPDQADVLLLGPNTRVQLLAGETGEDSGQAGAPIRIVVHGGTYRTVVRSLTGDATFDLSAGGRVMRLNAADAVGTYDEGNDDASYMLKNGKVAVKAGKRTLRLRPGMVRTIEGGKIRGAKQMSDESWEEAIATTGVPGVDLTQPVIVKAPPPPVEPVEDEHAGHDHARNTPVERTPAATPSVKATRDEPANNEAADGDYVYVRMSTSMGVIDLELDRGRAPISVKNFLSYVDKGYYEGTIFHRVINNFMIQGGGFTEDMQKKPTDRPIKNEWQNGLKNKRGTIAMARTNAPDSATSQFYINVVDNANLDQPRGGAAYAVFGKVINGMDVVDRIRAVPTGIKGRFRDVPMEPIVIDKVKQSTRDIVKP